MSIIHEHRYKDSCNQLNIVQTFKGKDKYEAYEEQYQVLKIKPAPGSQNKPTQCISRDLICYNRILFFVGLQSTRHFC